MSTYVDMHQEQRDRQAARASAAKAASPAVSDVPLQPSISPSMAPTTLQATVVVDLADAPWRRVGMPSGSSGSNVEVAAPKAMPKRKAGEIGLLGHISTIYLESHCKDRYTQRDRYACMPDTWHVHSFSCAHASIKISVTIP